MIKKLAVINRDDHVGRFLHAAGIEDTFEIKNKINEIIDYLEASKGEIKFNWSRYGKELVKDFIDKNYALRAEQREKLNKI